MAQRSKNNTTRIEFENLPSEIEIEENNNLEIEKEVKILRTISDVITRWNSTYKSWKRLLVLRQAIEWLFTTLYLQDEDGVKEDSDKLKSLMLDEHEWQLLKKLIEVFKPFDELTTYFSEIKYTTLSVVNPSIEALKFEFAEYNSEILNEDMLNYDKGKHKMRFFLILKGLKC